MPLNNTSSHDDSLSTVSLDSVEYQLGGKIVILRFNRLGHLPPALYETQLLNENGFSVVVVEFGREGDNFVKTIIDRDGIHKIRIGVFSRLSKFSPFFAMVKTIKILFKKIKKEGRPKLIVAHGLQEEWITYFLSILFKVPYVVHVHEVFDPPELTFFPRILLKLQKRILKQAEFLIFPEKSRAELYKKRYQLKNNIHIVFNSARMKTEKHRVKLQTKLGLPESSKLMLYLGGIGPVNAIEQGILSLPKFSDLYFLLGGWVDNDYKKNLLSMAEHYNVRDRLIFLGELNEDKWTYLENCDLSFCIYIPKLLRLKHAATASSKLMESIAAGLPVLTSGQPDFREIVEKHQIGMCVSEISREGISETLAQMLNPIGLKRMSQNAIRLHKETFNFEHQFSTALKAFEGKVSKPILEGTFELSKAS